MKYKIETTKDYAILIDLEAEVNNWDYHFNKTDKSLGMTCFSDDKNHDIHLSIGYYKLNPDANNLELPLLVDISQEETIEREFDKEYRDFVFDDEWEMILIKSAFEKGYKKAIRIGQAEDDIKMAIELTKSGLSTEEVIQKIRLNKISEEFITELNSDGNLNITTNSKGRKEIRGRWK